MTLHTPKQGLKTLGENEGSLGSTSLPLATVRPVRPAHMRREVIQFCNLRFL